MTSWDARPDVTPVGQAISWRADSAVDHRPRGDPHRPVSLAASVPIRPRTSRAPDSPRSRQCVADPLVASAGQGGSRHRQPGRHAGGNHLWQSTLCLAVAALLTLAFRRNRARVRYAIWVAASVKFLVPFAPLMALGRQFGWRTSATVVQPTMTVLMDTMSQPFSRPSTVDRRHPLPATSSYDRRRAASAPAAGDLARAVVS